MVAKFEPLGTKEDISATNKVNAENGDKVKQAKEAADVQEQETRRIEQKLKADLAEAHIKDIAEYKTKLVALEDEKYQLATEKKSWESQKATEQSEIQKNKSELERIKAELNKRERELKQIEDNLVLREKLVKERENLMSLVEKKELENTEKRNSKLEQLRAKFPQVKAHLMDIARTLAEIDNGLGYDLRDELIVLQKQYDNGIEKSCDKIIDYLQGEIIDCNQEAVRMSRAGVMPEVWNGIVDKLESIYGLMSILKPADIPGDIKPKVIKPKVSRMMA